MIDKFLPTIHGEFTVELGTGTRARRALGDRPAGVARASPSTASSPGADDPDHGWLHPDETGAWEVGVRAVGPVTVRVEGTTVVELAEARRGGSYYGLGSPEVRGVVELEGGRRYELEVEYPAATMSTCEGSRSAPAPCRAGTTSNGRSRRRARPRWPW